MFSHLIIFTIVLLVAAVTIRATKTNPQRDDIEKHLASKTPYRVIANKCDKEIKYPDCNATRIWAVIRHGTRHPSRKYIQWAKTYLTKLRDRIVSSKSTKLSNQQILALQKWTVGMDEAEEKYLVPEGEDELIELAERMQKRFPQLLPDYYDPLYYKFKYTATQRTKKSAESFATGLFGRHNIKRIIYPEALHKDPILRFYKLCNRWRAEVDKNPDAQAEVKMFGESDEMKRTLNAVMKKAGVTGLSVLEVHQMYMACAFETAQNKRQLSPWCAVFDRNTIRAMEYFKELEHYYVDGYGHKLTTRIACPAIKDMLDHISPSSVHPNATFYFSHSGTILKLLAHLHLYEDDFIMTHNDINKQRKWRISEIDAFASNIAFVTFSCKSETKVLTLHQERIVHLPGCPQNQDLCSLAKFRHILKDSIEHCQFDEICSL